MTFHTHNALLEYEKVAAHLFIRLLSIATNKAVGYINTNMKIELDTNIKKIYKYTIYEHNNT